jgi:protein-tyrosine phosphatase
MEPSEQLYRNGPEIEWERVGRIVFVCKGNICRSPYAEARAKLLGVESVSCGIEASPGASADEAACRNALIRGVDLSRHQSRRLDQLKLYSTDLVICMEPWQRAAVVGLAQNIGIQHAIGSNWPSGDQVGSAIADPFAKDDVVFQEVFERLDEIVAEIAVRVPAASRNRLQP